MFIYFIRANAVSPLIKIGKSRDPVQRMVRLQVGSPVRLVMLGMIKCKSDDHARQMERLAHNIFYRQRRHGEWFHLGAKHAAQISSLIARANERDAHEGQPWPPLSAK